MGRKYGKNHKAHGKSNEKHNKQIEPHYPNLSVIKVYSLIPILQISSLKYYLKRRISLP